MPPRALPRSFPEDGDRMNVGSEGVPARKGAMKNTVKAPEVSAQGRIRYKEDFTPEELARLQEKLEGWIQQTSPQSSRTKRHRHQFVMKSKKSEHA